MKIVLKSAPPIGSSYGVIINRVRKKEFQKLYEGAKKAVVQYLKSEIVRILSFGLVRVRI